MLDRQLDQYMSTSTRYNRSKLDEDIDNYMAKSKGHLDKSIDEYMSKAKKKPRTKKVPNGVENSGLEIE